MVLLDWDGTLLNSYASDTRAYLAMFRALKIEWTAAEIERHYSPNWYRVYEAAKIPKRIGCEPTGSGGAPMRVKARRCYREREACCGGCV